MTSSLLRAERIETYHVPKVDGKKFGRAPQPGWLEISFYANDTVRLKLIYPDQGIPVSDEVVPRAVYEQTRELLLTSNGCTLIDIFTVDKKTGRYVKKSHK